MFYLWIEFEALNSIIVVFLFQLIEPAESHSEEENFLYRFLRKHGAGVHHITFIVPSIKDGIICVAFSSQTLTQNEYFFNVSKKILIEKEKKCLIIYFKQSKERQHWVLKF
jgi:hypothetical protein